MSAYQLPPNEIDVLVIGGGPAGSYAASALAREGINVALLESSKFPRYHIGESLIPSVRPLMRYIDAEDTLAGHGFFRKPGSAIKFNQFKREGYTDFVALGCDNNAWNVDRAEFDNLLLKHARKSGALVCELTKVHSLGFDTDDPSRPVSASWSHVPSDGPDKIEGTTSFKYLIDATGRAGIMSTKYLKNRHFNASLKNIAIWGYWTDTGKYGVGTEREGSPWFEALKNESGWAWFIPLNGKTSVGIVMNQDVYNAKVGAPFSSPFAETAAPNASKTAMSASYVSKLSLAPGVVKLISEGGLLEEGSVKMASDFSYSAPNYAGNRYRIVGDAGAFIDPFFSSGIHLAMNSALSAAATICASIRGHCSEEESAGWHTKRVSISYTRFQLVVLSAYKQIRAQSMNVLTDIDEDNYDRAFEFLRPVIQGAADMGARLSEDEIQKSMDFCVNLFNPTSPDQHAEAARMVSKNQELFDVSAPIVDPSVVVKVLQESEENYENNKMVLDKINARRLVYTEWSGNNIESEDLDGFTASLERGKLGLKKV